MHPTLFPFSWPQIRSCSITSDPEGVNQTEILPTAPHCTAIFSADEFIIPESSASHVYLTSSNAVQLPYVYNSEPIQ